LQKVALLENKDVKNCFIHFICRETYSRKKIYRIKIEYRVSRPYSKPYAQIKATFQVFFHQLYSFSNLFFIVFDDNEVVNFHVTFSI